VGVVPSAHDGIGSEAARLRAPRTLGRGHSRGSALSDTISAIVVSYSDPIAARDAVESLLDQSEPPLEVLVFDNHPRGLTAAAMAHWGENDRVRLVHVGVNLGYAAACNRAAATARGDWLFFLNPDARADPDCLSFLCQCNGPAAGVVGAQVLLPDGRANAGDNPLHLSGLAWAGSFGEPREEGAPRLVATVSGAALLARRRAFVELGGMCERFFLYQDDVDLCWRMRLAGWEVVFCPNAVVWHDYEFDKGADKWFWLERNRPWCVLSNYSATSLVMLSPLLLLTEIAIGIRALRDGWGRHFARAWKANLRDLPQLLRWRRRVQATRRVSDDQIVGLMTGRFETQLMHSPTTARAGSVMELYRQAVLRALRHRDD
jgi:GT2 family glycosyltransferase